MRDAKLSMNGPNDARPGQELQAWRRHPEEQASRSKRKAFCAGASFPIG